MICLYLPRHAGDAVDEDQPLVAAPEAVGAQGGETIVLVDDEPLVRMLAAEQLEELG